MNYSMRLVFKKTRVHATNGENLMFTYIDSIPAYYRQTDRRTAHN